MLENLNISSIPFWWEIKGFLAIFLQSFLPACSASRPPYWQAGLPAGRQVFHYFGITDNLILKLN